MGVTDRIRSLLRASMQRLGVSSKSKLQNIHVQSFLSKPFTRHMHEDEEIRYILEGSGYFDVRGICILLPLGYPTLLNFYHRRNAKRRLDPPSRRARRSSRHTSRDIPPLHSRHQQQDQSYQALQRRAQVGPA